MDIDKYREEQKGKLLTIFDDDTGIKDEDAQNIITRYLNQAKEKETMDFIMDLVFNYEEYMSETQKYSIFSKIRLTNLDSLNYSLNNEEIVKVFFM